MIHLTGLVRVKNEPTGRTAVSARQLLCCWPNSDSILVPGRFGSENGCPMLWKY
jgi:hypothetical protein